MRWHTGKKVDMGDLMYGLPAPWCDMDGVEVSRSVSCITASVPLPEDLIQTLGDAAELARLNIGAVDKMNGEWVMSVGPNGERDESTPFVEIRV